MNHNFKFFLKIILEIFPYEVIKGNHYFLLKDRNKLYNIFYRFLANVKKLLNLRKLFIHFRVFNNSINFLEDSYSKNILIRIMVAKIYGFNKIIVSPKIYKFWNKFSVDFFLKLKQEKEILIAGGYELHLYDLNKINFPLKLLVMMNL